MRKPSRRRPRPHDGGFYREIDGPAGLVESKRSTGLSHSSSSAIAALSRRQGVLGPELPPGRRDRRPASSWPTTPRPARSCGGGGLVPPGEPGDETWGDVPYEDRVHVGS